MSDGSLRERLVKLETEMATLRESLDGIDTSLKDLVALKHKGMGAFWFASLIGASAVIAFAKQLWYWISGQGGSA